MTNIDSDKGEEMYEYDFRVSFCQSDMQHRMTIPAIVDAFQDCSCFHSDDSGVGFDYLEPRSLVWVISYWEIEFLKVPMYGSRVTVGTFPYGFKSIMGYRNYYLKDDKGEYIVKANSVWVLMDWDKQCIVKPTDELINAYDLEDRLDMDYSNKRKVEIPKFDTTGYFYIDGTEAVICEEGRLTIQRHHLDSNGHVNNCQYIKIAADYADADERYKKMYVEYRAQAHFGDEINIKAFDSEKGRLIVLEDTEGNPYSVILFAV